MWRELETSISMEFGYFQFRLAWWFVDNFLWVLELNDSCEKVIAAKTIQYNSLLHRKTWTQNFKHRGCIQGHIGLSVQPEKMMVQYSLSRSSGRGDDQLYIQKRLLRS